ncbi:MAG: helix-turn-helix domain-containing protein [Caldilineaceae bacterium]|nr:helix-turn-helix domain-containing protein [Caldilineaceae bacterium]
MIASKAYYSPEEVAALVGLHVRTIRRFIHEGRLTAVRVGKQYRITQSDLEKLVGAQRAAEPAESPNRRRRIIISTTVDIDAIDQREQERLVNLLLGAFHALHDQPTERRLDSIYYAEEARLRLLLHADLAVTNTLLSMIRSVLGEQGND